MCSLGAQGGQGRVDHNAGALAAKRSSSQARMARPAQQMRRGERPPHAAHPIVGMTKALDPSPPPSGQRWVIFLFLVQKRSPSTPY